MSSIFVNVIKDRYTTANEAVSRNRSGLATGDDKRKFIRRPVRGLQLRDETFATIRLVANVDGSSIPLVDAGSRRVYPQGYTQKSADGKTVVNLGGQPIQADRMRGTDIYSNFLLQQVQEERSEKFQILETFGEPYIFMFGERPRILTFQGILLNTFDFNWAAEWWHNYENYLRGTRCVELDARVFISYDYTLVSGYILSANATQSATDPNTANFSFQIFLTSYSTFTNLGNPNAVAGFPLTGESKPGNVLDVESFIKASASAEKERPVLVDYGRINIQGGGVNLNPSLIQSISDNLSLVKNAWSSVHNRVQSVLDGGPSALLSGDALFVPAGFAGALELQLADFVRLDPTAITFDAGIRYSTFDDNEDEYVGVGDHYGSSRDPYRVSSLDSEEQQLTYGQKFVEMARAEWAKKGYVLDDSRIGPTARGLVSGSLGLFSTAATQASSFGVQAGSAAAPFGAQLVHAAVPVE